jgi:hypothetical protein
LNSPKSGALEKTAVKTGDFLTRLFNTLFNPFARKNILTPPNATAWTGALHHAGGLAVGYGGLGLLVRKVVQSSQESKTQETLQRLRAFSAARNPTLSIDPDLDDEEQEKELENLGIPDLPVLKAAGSDAFKFFNPFSRITKREATGDHDPAHMALALSAVIAAGYGGWKLQDYIGDQGREKDRDTRVSNMRNLIDKMLFEEVQRTRLPQKAAAFVAASQFLEKEGRDFITSSSQQSKDFSSSGQGGASLGSAVGSVVGSPIRTIETLWWLWATAAFALSYAASKRFADKADPNRVRLKEIENIAKERAKVQDAPVLLDESSFSGAPVLKGSPEPPKPRSIAAVPVQGVKTKTPVDATDPYASILQ